MTTEATPELTDEESARIERILRELHHNYPATSEEGKAKGKDCRFCGIILGPRKETK